jgi:hypothetical protein
MRDGVAAASPINDKMANILLRGMSFLPVLTRRSLVWLRFEIERTDCAVLAFAARRPSNRYVREAGRRGRAANWIREQGLLDPTKLVFKDETSVNTSMVRPNRYDAASAKDTIESSIECELTIASPDDL